ncbi:MAG TPA: hypothetical protein ENO25_00615, partial [Desulfobacteraceae bacterium]|nr:hypothetical protein [Desulfobacteraceae bacterium]
MTRKTHSSRKSDAKAQQDRPAHPLKKEIAGLVFLLLAILLSGSLLSYHPDDRLFWNVTGEIGKAHNLFGAVGSHLAGILFDLLGFSSFWLAITLLVLAFMTFRGRTVASPLLNLIAIAALLASFSAILNLQFPGEVAFREGRMAAGGLVGLHLAGWAQGVLNHFGSYVFLATVFLVSLMVVTHLSLGRIFTGMGLAILGILRRARDMVTKIKERKKRIRKTKVAHHKIKLKPKVTILDPKPTTDPAPQQEDFPFMNVAGEFKLPPLDLL